MFTMARFVHQDAGKNASFSSMRAPLFLVILVSFWISPGSAECGYKSCTKEVPGMINVHLVSHTHTDPGWVLTADQYYYREVQFIIDTVIDELEKDPNRRFTYVEMSFFTRWWRQQDDAMKKKVKDLMNQGRLEFTMGGWVMNDEATVHYSATIDQHTLGFEFLRQTFGECGRTTIGWQIDPFGHSREQASLFAQFGFNGFFFGRMDYQDFDNRQKTNTMEFIWHGSPDNLGNHSDIFTGVLPHSYVYPPGFKFDVSYIYKYPTYAETQKMIHDDPTLNDYNVDKMVKGFLGKVKMYNSWYNTDHLLVPMGCDYNYVDAHFNFKEIDKLIKYVNAEQINGSKVNLLYSTPSCYVKAIHDAQRTWTTKSDDLLPYASNEHRYWTGFFASRPALKLYARRMNTFLQGTRHLTALAQLDNSKGALDNIHQLAAAVAVNQHHDAITGTEKQIVAYDYAQRMSKGQAAAQETVKAAYSVLMSKGDNADTPEQVFCNYLNVSVCNLTSGENNFEITIYNPLSWEVNQTVKIPFTAKHYDLLAADGKTKVSNTVFPVASSPSGICPKGMTPTHSELVFLANLPPLGFATYFVQIKSPPKKTGLTNNNAYAKHVESSKTFTMKGKYVEIHFEDGEVSKIVNRVSNTSSPLSQEFLHYIPSTGNSSQPEFQASGAYIFRPKKNTKPVKIPLAVTKFFMGENNDSVALMKYTDWLYQVIRVYNDKPYIEFEWTVGPIPVHDGGKEIITRYNLPGFGNKGVFYTDSNGREILERKLNYRPTWKVDIDEPVAGNYFPVDSHIHIKSADSKQQFSVLVDRAQGGTSLNDGDVELMIHRRLLHDDNKGVHEALNEPGLDGKGLIIRGSHYVLLEKVEDSASNFRPLAQEIIKTGQLSFSNYGVSPAQYTNKFHTKLSGLAENLPPAVHILSLERFRTDGPVASPSGSVPYLVRFEHFYEAKEDPSYSSPVTFDIKNLFQDLVFVNATELALGANVPAADIHRLDWKFKERGTTSVTAARLPKALDGTKLTLKPMQIVTLQIDFKRQ